MFILLYILTSGKLVVNNDRPFVGVNEAVQGLITQKDNPLKYEENGTVPPFTDFDRGVTLDELINIIFWRKTKYIDSIGYTEGGKGQIYANMSGDGYKYDRYTYSDQININESGVITLVDPKVLDYSSKTRSDSNDIAILNALRGKYFYSSQLGIAGIAYVTDNSSITKDTSSGFRIFITNCNISFYSYKDSEYEILASSDPTKYPPNDPGEYTWENIGKMGDQFKIQHGLYVGTGKTAKFKFSLNFRPTIICLVNSNYSNDGNKVLAAFDGMNYIASNVAITMLDTGFMLNFSTDSNTLNQNGVTYHYIAIRC